jgi:hypothetical protein
MFEEIAGINLRFRDTITDFGPRELHDYIRGAGGEGPEIHGVRDGNWIVTPAAGTTTDLDSSSAGRLGRAGRGRRVLD